MTRRRAADPAVEARARITWGDPPDEVRDWLVAQGVDRVVAEDVVAGAVRGRDLALRWKGTKDVVWGSALALGSFGLVLAPFLVPRFFDSDLGGAVGLAFLAGLFGLSLVFRGAARIARGASIEGGVSDVTD